VDLYTTTTGVPWRDIVANCAKRFGYIMTTQTGADRPRFLSAARRGCGAGGGTQRLAKRRGRYQRPLAVPLRPVVPVHLGAAGGLVSGVRITLSKLRCATLALARGAPAVGPALPGLGPFAAWGTGEAQRRLLWGRRSRWSKSGPSATAPGRRSRVSDRLDAPATGAKPSRSCRHTVISLDFLRTSLSFPDVACIPQNTCA
jgi:hypothetical protein